MPTTRRRRPRALSAPRIPQAAVDAYRLAREIEEAGQTEAWEAEGGRHVEYINARVALASALGIHPHKSNPLDAVQPAPPEWMTDPDQRLWWAEAWELRQSLEGATDGNE